MACKKKTRELKITTQLVIFGSLSQWIGAVLSSLIIYWYKKVGLVGLTKSLGLASINRHAFKKAWAWFDCFFFFVGSWAWFNCYKSQAELDQKQGRPLIGCLTFFPSLSIEDESYKLGAEFFYATNDDMEPNNVTFVKNTSAPASDTTYKNNDTIRKEGAQG